MKVGTQQNYTGFSQTNTRTSYTTTSGTTRTTGNKTKSNSNKSRIKKSISALSYMIRLANARTSPEVARVMKSIRVEVSSLKSTSATDKQIAQAERLADKIQEKGMLKIGKLRKEKIIHQRKVMEEAAKHRRKAQELERELHKKVRGRKAMERQDIINSIEYKDKKTQANEAFEEHIGSVVDVSADLDLSACDVETAVDISL